MRASSLRVPLHRSPILAGILIVIHVAATTCVAGYLQWWFSVPLATGILASLVFHVRRDALQLAPQSVTELLLKDGGRCELALWNGAILHGRISDSTFVAASLIVVNVSIDDRRWPRGLVLLPDAASAEARRQLRIRLRYSLGGEAKEPEPV